MKIIAKIHTDFTDKFGIPRQSGMVPELMGRIVLNRNTGTLRHLKDWKDLIIYGSYGNFHVR